MDKFDQFDQSMDKLMDKKMMDRLYSWDIDGSIDRWWIDRLDEI